MTIELVSSTFSLNYSHMLSENIATAQTAAVATSTCVDVHAQHNIHMHETYVCTTVTSGSLFL